MKSLNEFSEILDTSNIMEIFGISKAGAYRLMRKKDFPSFKMLGKYSVQKQSLIKWLERQEQIAYKNK
ncbi:MAG: helix-turn-helix domain-containing protein [Oscillospiraceae bacterium]|nr:helix-turn-helix domain-containing protein [Oscillospiraceae bacterium]